MLPLTHIVRASLLFPAGFRYTHLRKGRPADPAAPWFQINDDTYVINPLEAEPAVHVTDTSVLRPEWRLCRINVAGSTSITAGPAAIDDDVESSLMPPQPLFRHPGPLAPLLQS